MSTLSLFAAILAVLFSDIRSGFAQQPYDGSLTQFLTYLADHQLSDLALPEWSSGGKIDYFTGPDGKQLRYAYWPRADRRPALGTIIHFNGRTEFIERNVLTYRDLANRGWDVWTMDWRGQGLSSRLLSDRDAVRGHIDDFATYVADASFFIDNVVKLQERPGLHVLIAHSMGGQVALRYLLEHSNTFDRVVLSSPLVGLPRGWMATADELLKDVLSKLPQVTEGCVPGRADQWESSFKEPPCVAINDPDNRLLLDPSGAAQYTGPVRDPEGTAEYTHDPSNIAIGECLIEQSRRSGSGPGLAVACPTGGWLVAARQSTEVVWDERSNLAMPILIVAAEKDTAVDPDAQRELCAKLAHCTYVPTPNAGHELLIEQPKIREAFLKCLDGFVADASAGGAKCAEIVQGMDVR